jgi:hypothetical protein
MIGTTLLSAWPHATKPNCQSAIVLAHARTNAGRDREIARR